MVAKETTCDRRVLLKRFSAVMESGETARVTSSTSTRTETLAVSVPELANKSFIIILLIMYRTIFRSLEPVEICQCFWHHHEYFRANDALTEHWWTN